MLDRPNFPYFIQLVISGKPEDCTEEYIFKYYLRVVNYYQGQEPLFYDDDCEGAYYEADLIDSWNSDDSTVGVCNGQTINNEDNTFQGVVELSDEVLLNLHNDLIPLPGESMDITESCTGLLEMRRCYRVGLENTLQEELNNYNKFNPENLTSILSKVIHEANVWSNNNKKFIKS